METIDVRFCVPGHFAGLTTDARPCPAFHITSYVMPNDLLLWEFGRGMFRRMRETMDEIKHISVKAHQNERVWVASDDVT